MFEKGNSVGRKFKPGVSGNAKGRTPILAEIREIASKNTKAMIQVLVDIANDAKAPPSARVAAANHVLDRAYGKPPQSLEHSGDGLVFQIVTGISRSPDEPFVIEAEAEEVRH